MTDLLDKLYATWMKAEADEQAALLLLNVRDDIEMRVRYEQCVERCEAAREDYEMQLTKESSSVA